MAFAYILNGTITKADASAAASATVSVRNDSTMDTLSDTTNASGQYAFDLQNFTKGWNVGDTITVTCNIGTEYGDDSFTIASETTNTINITTVAVVTSTGEYSSIQDVYDALDGKTSSDISTKRVNDAILRAEGIIDKRTGTSFKENTITDEVYDLTLESLYYSPNQSLSTGLARADGGISSSTRCRLNHRPIISITNLYTNSAGETSADDWTEIDEQSGSGGDFTCYKKKGVIEWLQNTPSLKRRSFKTTYTWGIDRDTTDPDEIRTLSVVRRLAVLLSIQDILSSKGSSSQFESPDNIALEGISISKGIGGTTAYLLSINEEIESLFRTLGDFLSWNITGVEVL